MRNYTAVRIAALLGFAAVALGAFGAHGLKEVLARNGTVQTWHTAVLYHFMHTLVLLVLARSEPVPKGPSFCFLLGILVFSGSLYLLAVTNLKWLGAITPLGGLSFLAGWLWIFAAPAIVRGGKGTS